jgi:hypothetical protein
MRFKSTVCAVAKIIRAKMNDRPRKRVARNRS